MKIQKLQMNLAVQHGKKIDHDIHTPGTSLDDLSSFLDGTAIASPQLEASSNRGASNHPLK